MIKVLELNVGPFSVVDAAIRANGNTYSIFDQSKSGGSSGGTIILESKKVNKQTNKQTR